MMRKKRGPGWSRALVFLLSKVKIGRTVNGRFRVIFTCASILTLLMLNWSSPATTASTEAASSTEECLKCHGPFDKLASATTNYMMPSGEKTTPHRYVPHKSEEMPECIKCHRPHPVPLTSKAEMPKAETDYCYTCHHAKVLQCGTCHN